MVLCVPGAAVLLWRQVDTTVLGLTPEEAKAKPYIASMGIYVFKKGVLGECLVCWHTASGHASHVTHSVWARVTRAHTHTRERQSFWPVRGWPGTICTAATPRSVLC